MCGGARSLAAAVEDHDRDGRVIWGDSVAASTQTIQTPADSRDWGAVRGRRVLLPCFLDDDGQHSNDGWCVVGVGVVQCSVSQQHGAPRPAEQPHHPRVTTLHNHNNTVSCGHNPASIVTVQTRSWRDCCACAWPDITTITGKQCGLGRCGDKTHSVTHDSLVSVHVRHSTFLIESHNTTQQQHTCSAREHLQCSVSDTGRCHTA